MLPTILAILIGLVLFIIPILAYREGIRIGMQISKGIEPKPLQSPVGLINDTINEFKDIKVENKNKIQEEKAQEESLLKQTEYNNYWQSVWDYNGTPKKE